MEEHPDSGGYGLTGLRRRIERQTHRRLCGGVVEHLVSGLDHRRGHGASGVHVDDNGDVSVQVQFSGCCGIGEVRLLQQSGRA